MTVMYKMVNVGKRNLSPFFRFKSVEFLPTPLHGTHKFVFTLICGHYSFYNSL